MAEQYLPLFPLQLVLFPRTTLPLHIFEDRYKEMMTEVIRTHSEFGVVQAGEKGIVNTGCTATIEKILKQYPDGRLDLFTMGRRRFEIMILNDEKPYLRGSVEFFDDEEFEPVPEDLQKRAMASFHELRTLEDQPVASEPEFTDPQLSFQLANFLSDLDFRQILLATRSEAERLKQLMEFLPGYVLKQKRLAHVREIVPRNGHANWPLS